MLIKKYVCKCGSNDFAPLKKGPHIGIYCSRCGKFYKWASRDERNLIKLNKGAEYGAV